GIGRWTAEMFLIFHLSRPDVLPLQDLGLLKARDLHYPSTKPRTKSEYLALAEAGRPYRSIATWYLWRALDPVPVAY
ncbi:MAG: DNA-3-methyladenine glycosylase 2 family protein, partial [Alphaproteobacteria bacterium]